MRLDISAIIFDLDGLVLDSETTYFSAWRQAAGAMGFTLSDSGCESLSGLHYGAVEQKLIEFFGPDFNLDEFRQQSGEYWRHHVRRHGIQVKTGFHELHAQLQRLNLPFCLATNSRLANALECLDLAGLADTFPVIVARDHVVRGKPEPDIFWAAAERLSTEISRCLILEDSPIGILAAVSAGAMSVFVPSASPPDTEAARLCSKQCRDLGEVARMLQANFTNR